MDFKIGDKVRRIHKTAFAGVSQGDEVYVVGTGPLLLSKKMGGPAISAGLTAMPSCFAPGSFELVAPEEPLFQKGDRVWTAVHGWGTVHRLERGQPFPVRVNFDNALPSHERHDVGFTADGRYVTHTRDAIRVLFFAEVVTPKEALERPKKLIAAAGSVVSYSVNGGIVYRQLSSPIYEGDTYFEHFFDGSNNQTSTQPMKRLGFTVIQHKETT